MSLEQQARKQCREQRKAELMKSLTEAKKQMPISNFEISFQGDEGRDYRTPTQIQQEERAAKHKIELWAEDKDLKAMISEVWDDL